MKELEGDLLKMFVNDDFKIIIHGCNCFCMMSAGIASSIAKQFPEVLLADKKTKYGDISKLGTISYCEVGNGIVINLYSQYKPGPNIDYEALKSGFKKVKEIFGNKNLKFGIPAIGCGIAGGSWDIVKNIVLKEMLNEDITYVKYIL